MIFADLALARRLEYAEGGNAVEMGCEVEEIAGGYAIFAAPGSPLSHAVGLGLNGPVPDSEIDRLERFYAARGETPSADICPLADPSLIESMMQRGYRIGEFGNVLARELGGPLDPDPRIRLAGPGDADLWARTVAAGFLEKDRFTREEMQVGLTLFRMNGAKCFIAGEEAAGALAIRSGLAMLFADSTRPSARRNGLHSALIRTRLAAAHNCDLAAASTLPGSASQRNYERLGFRVIYTKFTLIAAGPAA